MARRPISHLSVAKPESGSDAPALACDVAIIGGGIAGLSVALNLPSELRVVLVTKHTLGESNTRYAQGGLAAPIGLDDSPRLHLTDTVVAGAGLVDEDAARILVDEAGESVHWLIEAGTRFDRRAQEHTESHMSHTLPWKQAAEGGDRRTDDLATGYDLAREAAHSRRRVLHAQGDATGAEIERALVQALRERPAVSILEDTSALDLLVEDGTCTGAELWHRERRLRVTARLAVVLANGGAGQLWKRTSNPKGATADGLALAFRAGAALADLEFMQFHPTVLVPPEDSSEAFLVSEAVRGEGAYLRNLVGDRFMFRYHPDAELAPRDVVARAIQSELLADGAVSAFLDLRHLPESEVRHRFPTIGAVCRRYGFDLAHDLIPVAPAAHYFMGGVAVDTTARTTLPHLYAVGEVACTGVHGANRLASNSLLEGLVFGRRAARAIAAESVRTLAQRWPESPVLTGAAVDLTGLVEPQVRLDISVAAQVRDNLRRVMWERVALARNASGLRSAVEALRQLAVQGPVDFETANMLFAAQAITTCALARNESRGAHYRADFPASDPLLAGRHTLVPARPAGAAQRHSEGPATYVHA
ncbi:MAG: L-aspartate oxidase [Chloroflexi bacterium]|nr:MAG: L-aspartate oxidase [Chloroflexota bacterium]